MDVFRRVSETGRYPKSSNSGDIYYFSVGSVGADCYSHFESNLWTHSDRTSWIEDKCYFIDVEGVHEMWSNVSVSNTAGSVDCVGVGAVFLVFDMLLSKI